jgi:hypothetical protein
MSVLWHVMFWLMLPVSLYATLWAYSRLER